MKNGISIVVKMVETTITLIAAMMGPIEFSAKTENKKASEATVTIDNTAKPQAAKYLHKTSCLSMSKSLPLVGTIKSLVPNKSIEHLQQQTSMWQLTKIETFKIFKKPRTYIAFAAIAAIIFLVQLAFYIDGNAYIDFMLQTVESSFVIEGNKMNGYFVFFVILQTLLVHVPLLISLVAGDMIAGEANMGTLRLLAAKPVSRSSIILSKFFATFIYTLLLLTFMAVIGLLGFIRAGISFLCIFRTMLSLFST